MNKDNREEGLEYIIIKSIDEKYVEKEVSRLLLKGWKLHGSLSIAMDNYHGPLFAQVLVASIEYA